MGELIDDVVEADREIARAITRRAAVIDKAWSEATASLVPPAPSIVRRWRTQAVARRSLVSELAAALRPSDKAAFPFAMRLSLGRFDRNARVLRERAHPESIELPHSTSRDTREVSIQPGLDGMSWLTAHLPSATARAIYDRVTDVATHLQSTTEPRTLTQLRPDVFGHLLVDLLFDGSVPADHPRQPNLGRGIRARVLITVPVLTLLGHGSEPAMLEGCGPIDIETERVLVADAPGFTRTLTHPETGAVLSLGRDRCPIPPDLRAWLRMRDENCRAPPCGERARRCHLDHTEHWQHGGRSDHNNLAHLRPKHHDEKHHTGWKVKNVGEGDLEWASPTGHRHLTEPATRLTPRH